MYTVRAVAVPPTGACRMYAQQFFQDADWKPMPEAVVRGGEQHWNFLNDAEQADLHCFLFDVVDMNFGLDKFGGESN